MAQPPAPPKEMLDALPPGHEIAWEEGEYVARPTESWWTSGKPGSLLGDIIGPGGLMLPNPLGAGVGGMTSTVKGLAALPGLAWRGIKAIPEAVTSPIETAKAAGGAIGQGVVNAPSALWDFLKTSGPTEIATKFAEPLVGAAGLGAARTGLTGLSKAVTRHLPGAAVGAQAAAKKGMETWAERIRPQTAPPAGELIENALAGAAPGTEVALPNLLSAAEKVSGQYAQRSPGLPRPGGAAARGIQQTLGGQVPQIVDTGVVDAGGNPILQTILRPATGARPLAATQEELKGINDLIGQYKAKGGVGLGAARTFSRGLHQDLEAAANVPGADPAIRSLAEAIGEAEKGFLAGEARHALRPGGGIVGTRPTGDFEWARPQKFLDWMANHPNWERRVGATMGQPFVEALKADMARMIPMSERALPRALGANVGSYRAVVGGTLGAGASTAMGGNPWLGAILGHWVPEGVSRAMRTGPGMRAAEWAFTPSGPMGVSRLGAAAPLADNDYLRRILGQGAGP